MNMIGGSQLSEGEFIMFVEILKKLTKKTYLVDVLLIKEKRVELTECKVKMKVLLHSYNKKSMFDVLNNIVVRVAKSNDYKDVADDDERYDFVGMTEKVLKKIEINYGFSEEALDAIRNIMATRALLGISADSADDRSSSSSSSSS
jgi:hypothetical protein